MPPASRKPTAACVSTGDYDGDGWLDLYVANDGAPNQLWINQKNGTFTDMGLVSGAAETPQAILRQYGHCFR